MKKLIALLCVFVLTISLSACGSNEITLDFSFGQRTGNYTGDMADELPHGQGKFVTKNDDGESWTYEGEFANGHMEGEGKTTWADGTVEIGTYENDVVIPVSGDAVRTLWTTPEDFKNQVVEIIGRVFVEPEYSDDGVSLQIWGDPQKSENNTVIYFADAAFRCENNDYVRVIGLVGDIFKGTNAYGGEVSAPTINARSVEVLSYKDAVAPAISDITVDKTLTQYGYSVTLQKVEFAESETRIYLKIENNGTSNFNLYSFNSLLIQNGEQFSEQSNWEADYPPIQTGLAPSSSTEGVIVFPAVEEGALKLTFECSSDDWNERIKPFGYDLNADGTVNEPIIPVVSEFSINETLTQYGYSVTLQKIEFDASETRVYVQVENNGGSTFNLYSFNAIILQNGKQYSEQQNWEENYPQIQTGLLPTASTEGIIAFPAIEEGALRLILECSSDDWNEDIEPFEFDIDDNGSLIES